MTSAATERAGGAQAAGAFDLDAAWMLHPAVSVRPEPFGALLYHFGNRRLSFLKTRQLLDIVQALDTATSAREACLQCGVAPAELSSVARALGALEAGSTIRRRPPQPSDDPHGVSPDAATTAPSNDRENAL